MWTTRMLRLPRIPSSELDYARHMPEEYVKRVKRTVPRKVYANRFGAPNITHWRIHPDDSTPSTDRPWINKELQKSLERENNYHEALLTKKYFHLRRPKASRITDEKWTFFPGDIVQILVGKDKGRQGTICRISRATNEVFVDGLHTKLVADMEGSEKMGIEKHYKWEEQPLSVEKAQVSLVDPNDNEPCTAKWVLSDSGEEYMRVSNRSGFEIPIPSQAEITYEYLQADKYIEVEEKDTTSVDVLRRTYVPKLASFEQEISESIGIKEERKRKPTYWY